MSKLADLIFQRDRLREELSKIEKEISVLTQKTPSLNLPYTHETPKDTDQQKPSDSVPLTPQQKVSLFFELFKGRGSLPKGGNLSTIHKRPDIHRFASNVPVNAEGHIPSAKIAPTSVTNLSQQKT
mgnify:CR=1 FL=1